jgi:hypothetical protein
MVHIAVTAVLLAVLGAPTWAGETLTAPPRGEPQSLGETSTAGSSSATTTADDCGCRGPGGGCCKGAAAAPPPEEAPHRGCGCGMKKRDASPPTP